MPPMSSDERLQPVIRSDNVNQKEESHDTRNHDQRHTQPELQRVPLLFGVLGVRARDEDS